MMLRRRTNPKTMTHILQAYAVEMHISIPQEAFYTESYRKTAAAQLEHPDQAPAFTPTGRTPVIPVCVCEHTVNGTKTTKPMWPLPLYVVLPQ